MKKNSSTPFRLRNKASVSAPPRLRKKIKFTLHSRFRQQPIFYLCLLSLLISSPSFSSEIHVSPSGSDTQPGTALLPKQSIHAALREAREWRRLNDPRTTNGIHIILHAGTYFLSEPVFLRPEDAGSPQSPTTIAAAPGETPIISGGVSLKGWKKNTNQIQGVSGGIKKEIYTLNVYDQTKLFLNFRQLWINGQKATRARKGSEKNMQRILSWDHASATCVIPDTFSSLQFQPGMEMMIHQWWAIAHLRIRSIRQEGEGTRLFFHEPESRIQNEHPWPAPWISEETGNSAYILSNSPQFLDQPGEWYFDRTSGNLYYYPLPGEDMDAVETIVPSQETLVEITGTPEHPVSHIQFQGVHFRHSTWLRPSEKGHVPLQAGMFLLDAYKLQIPGTPEKESLENQAWIGRQPAAVQVSYAHNLLFRDCRFTQLGATGIDFTKGATKDTVQGCFFSDIAGTAIQAGYFGEAALETHLPYRSERKSDWCSDLLFSNNYIVDCANEDWGCVGIAAGYLQNTTIAHNELAELPYSGISLGWGWTSIPTMAGNNHVTANYIHHYGKQMYDVAGIYTLSAQPGSVIEHNRVDSIYKAPFPHIPSHWFYLYTDEGTSGFTIRNNWTPAHKFLQNANGPNNTWEKNGPEAGEKIRDAAGLEDGFSSLKNLYKAEFNAFPINQAMPVGLEIVFSKKHSRKVKEMYPLLEKHGIPPSSFFQWKNRWMIFHDVKDVFMFRNALKEKFPEAEIKTYDDPFYHFSVKNCPGTTEKYPVSNQHFLLTARLVEDDSLQQQYMEYHRTQMEEWPEVAQGFCNAEFERLLIYRNKDQLFLVITLPEGKTLDELNPKTVENNPKMVEWNRLMQKFQCGIPGTKKGETWILYEPVKTN